VPRLSLSCLGPFQACLDDRHLARFRTDKMRALLTYLAVEAEIPHRREALADLFWPDQAPDTARQNLRQTLTRLGRSIANREADPPFLLITSKTVAFNPESEHWLDVTAFTSQIEAVQKHHHRPTNICPQCIGQLETALDWYRGDFLAGLSIDGSITFEEWRLYHQERLHNLALEALNILGDYHERRENYTEVIQFTHRQLAIEPWREAAHRRLIRSLALNGQRSSALAQYETCRRILADELNAEPEDVTRTLYRQIRAGGVAIDALRPPPLLHNLPETLTPFMGRQTELTQIAHQFDSPNCRLLTIIGPGGVGKTRLALQAALEQRYAFPGGVWFVPLASIHSPDLLISSIVQSLGVNTEQSQDPKAQLLAFLHSRETLLVLDNFEHLIAGADLLLEILRNAPDVRILVTSRERLNYQAEQLLVLEGLPYPEKNKPPKMAGQEWDAKEPDHAAIQLFVERAGRVRNGFTASPDTLSQIVHICRLVEGLPLGIELAAAWSMELTPSEIGNQIQKSLDFLAVSLRDMPSRQHSLRATFEYSWNLLSNQEQVIYRQLAVFRGTFTAEAADAVIDHRFPVISYLNALAAKSLLRQNSTGRYDQHPLLRQFALEKLDSQPTEANQANSQHAYYYLDFIQQKLPTLRSAAAQTALADISADLDNVRSAWNWCVDNGQITLLQQGAPSLAFYYNRTGLFQEGEAAFRRADEKIFSQFELPEALVAHTPSMQNLQARLKLEQARFLFGQGAYTDIPELTQAVITLSTACQDAILESEANLFRGYVPLFQSEIDQAQACFNRALFLTRSCLGSIPPPSDQERTRLLEIEANSLNSLSVASKRQGQFDQAKGYLEESLQAAQQAKDLAGKSRALNGLGMIATRQGDFSEALIYYPQALQCSQACGDRRIEGALLNNLGNVYLYLGMYAEAIDHYQKALEIQDKIGTRQKQIAARVNLGLIHNYQGDQKTAYVQFQQAMQIAKKIDDRFAQVSIYVGLGYTFFGLGDLDNAREAYQKSIHLRREIGRNRMATEPLEGLARIALAEGKTALALEYVEEIFVQIDDCQKLDGLINPFQVCLTCIQVLQAVGDSCAHETLHRTHEQLQSRAARISDDKLRHSFLTNVISHQKLIQLHRTSE
jgi:predicted ATPase/DNA-binding SARP family transcriptional activator/tetratricopeptide (TPR) repeat protein